MAECIYSFIQSHSHLQNNTLQGHHLLGDSHSHSKHCSNSVPHHHHKQPPYHLSHNKLCLNALQSLQYSWSFWSGMLGVSVNPSTCCSIWSGVTGILLLKSHSWLWVLLSKTSCKMGVSCWKLSVSFWQRDMLFLYADALFLSRLRPNSNMA